MQGLMKYTTVGVAALLASTLLAACGANTGTSTGSSGGGSQSAAPISVSIGNLKGTILTLPLTVADQEGLFKAAGLNATIVNEPYGSLVPALIGGSTQFTAADPGLVYGAINQGENLVAIGPIANLDNLLVTSPNSGITTIEQLKGKNIGIIGLGGQTQVFASDALQTHGVSPSDVTFVDAGSFAATLAAAVANGRVDAAVMSTGSLDLFQSQGGKLNVVADSLAGTAGPFSKIAISSWYTTTAAYQQQNPTAVKAFCSAMSNAGKFISDPANRTNVIKDIGLATGMTDQTVMGQVYDKLHTLWVSDLSASRWQANSEALLKGKAVPYSHWMGSCS